MAIRPQSLRKIRTNGLDRQAERSLLSVTVAIGFFGCSAWEKKRKQLGIQGQFLSKKMEFRLWGVS